MNGLPEPVFERCWCTGVDRAALAAAWRTGARSVDALRLRTGVCGGCGTCRPEVECLVAHLAAAERSGRPPR